jgi:hypothetical protein
MRESTGPPPSVDEISSAVISSLRETTPARRSNLREDSVARRSNLGEGSVAPTIIDISVAGSGSQNVPIATPRQPVYVTREDMVAIRDLYVGAVNMRELIEDQEEPYHFMRTEVETYGVMLRFTKIKLAQAKEQGNERTISSLKKQISEFEKIVGPKEQQLLTWNAAGRRKWDSLKNHTILMQYELLADECSQHPDEVGEYLERVREVVDSDEHWERMQALDKKVRELEAYVKEHRKKMVQILPKDYETEWDTFMVIAARMQKQIEIAEAHKRRAQKGMELFEFANKEYKKHQERHTYAVKRAAAHPGQRRTTGRERASRASRGGQASTSLEETPAAEFEVPPGPLEDALERFHKVYRFSCSPADFEIHS